MKIPLSVCEQRDPKGLYKAARAGKIKGADETTGEQTVNLALRCFALPASRPARRLEQWPEVSGGLLLCVGAQGSRASMTRMRSPATQSWSSRRAHRRSDGCLAAPRLPLLGSVSSRLVNQCMPPCPYVSIRL